MTQLAPESHLCITHFTILPAVRDYRIRTALGSCDQDVRSTLLIDRPGYDDRFENLGHGGDAVAVWRPAAGTRWDQIRQRAFGMRAAGQRLRELVRRFGTDVIHTHNRGHLAYHAKRLTDLPVVHDISDFYSIFPHDQLKRNRAYWNPITGFDHWQQLRYERFAFKYCDAVTFNSTHMLEVARERYGIQGATAVIPNAVPRTDLPEKELPKLSDTDGQVHTVFVGHVNSHKLAPLVQIARREVHVHLYTMQALSFERRLREISLDQPYLHWHGAVPYRRLLLELTQYDFGLALWYPEADALFFQVSLPSKLFDYLASGLPVIVGPYGALSDFVESKRCGFVLNDVGEMKELLCESYDVGDREQYTMEYYVPRLVELYHSLV